MRLASVVLLSALAFSGVALAQTAPSLSGLWAAADGTGSARLAPCAGDLNLMCATVVSDVPEPGQPSAVGQIVLRDLAPTGSGRWRGQYQNGSELLPATVRLRGKDSVEFKVCVAMFCSTERYNRVGS